MEFTNKEFKNFQKDVQSALKCVEEKYGITVECGRITYGDVDFKMQLHVTKKDTNTDGKRILFDQDCAFYGFSKEDYEREFILQGKRFKLVGFNRKSPVNCCQIVDVNTGNLYKCSADAVKRGFERVL